MLGLVGEATQGIVAELCHLVAEFRSFIAHGIGAIAKLIGDAVQQGSNGARNAFGSLSRARRRAAASPFDALLERAQAPFDLADIGGHRVGITGSTKHDFNLWKREQSGVCASISLLTAITRKTRRSL
jgi:hypothetical protein